jgi:CYTH domain-containing protein
MIELELTYLAKFLPAGLEKCKHKEIIDVFFPATAEHPVLRLRKNGEKFELTKKEPINKGDSSEQLEQTIILSREEFEVFSQLKGKRFAKERYFFPFNSKTAEIDIYKEGLAGLVLVDFEFKSSEEKKAFKMPDFCLADVTQETFVAGGMLCGKKYSDIEEKLERYGYKKLFLK